MQLREYQAQALENIRAEIEKAGGAPFIVDAPTGSGKSVLIAEVARHLIRGGVLVLQPNVELLRQNLAKIKQWSTRAPVGVYSASANEKSKGVITMATLGSAKATSWSGYDTLLVDEADFGFDTTKNSVFMNFVKQNNFKNVIGFTATPYRLHSKVKRVQTRSGSFFTSDTRIMMLNKLRAKGGGNKIFWKKILPTTTTEKLLEQGWLTPLEYFVERPQSLSTLRVNSSSTEYTQQSLNVFSSVIENRVCEGVRAVLTRLNHKKVLVYVSSVESAHNLSEWAMSAGFPSGVIEANTKRKEREQLLAGFKCGKVRVLFNVATLTTGVDVPDLDAIIIARPTLSPRLHVQILGRLTRLAEGKTRGAVYDLVGNTYRFGKLEQIKAVNNMLFGATGRLDDVSLDLLAGGLQMRKQSSRGLLW